MKASEFITETDGSATTSGNIASVSTVLGNGEVIRRSTTEKKNKKGDTPNDK